MFHVEHPTIMGIYQTIRKGVNYFKELYKTGPKAYLLYSPRFCWHKVTAKSLIKTSGEQKKVKKKRKYALSLCM